MDRSARMTFAPGRRTAVVAGVRTPFVRSGGVFADLSSADLGRHAVAELVARAQIRAEEIDELIFGTVVPIVSMPNISREVGLLAGLPRALPAFSVTRACATSNQAVTDAAEKIAAGLDDVVVAGGTESLSDVPILFTKRFSRRLVAAQKAKTLGARIGALLGGFSPRELAPQAPAIAEASTGLSMGQSAEKMAKENGIPREAQDELARASHEKAAAGWDSGVLREEVAPVLLRDGRLVAEDDIVRRDTTGEKLAALRPVFDRKWGTITAGNSSPLTDGAGAVLLMSEERARAEGRKILAFVRSWAYAALDPGDQLLQGPAYAAPLALDRAGLRLSDIDRIEMHEAFAAQVLSNVQALGSKSFAEEKLGRSEAVGEVDPAKLNLQGGSIALGHPFGATGARLVTTLARAISRDRLRFGLITVCAAGGLGAAMVLESAESA
jgi:acetyl-CoA acyltransferase